MSPGWRPDSAACEAGQGGAGRADRSPAVRPSDRPTDRPSDIRLSSGVEMLLTTEIVPPEYKQRKESNFLNSFSLDTRWLHPHGQRQQHVIRCGGLFLLKKFVVFFSDVFDRVKLSG